MRTQRVALAVMTMLLLAGCATTDPLPDRTPTVSPRPTSSTSPVDTPALPPAPTLRYASTCDELVPPNLLTEAFGDDSVRAGNAPDYVLSPIGAGVRQQGGLTCNWGNGEPAHLTPGYGNPAYKNLIIHLLPDPENKWHTYVSTGYPQDSIDQQFGSGSGTGCFAHADGTSCSVNVLVGASWVELLFQGVEVPEGTTDAEFTAQMRPVITRILERISDPTPASGARPDPSVPSCEVILPVELVRDTLGLESDQILQIDNHAGGYSLLAAGGEYSAVQRCIVGNGTEEVFATAGVLPGGAWMFSPAESPQGIAVGAEKVAVRGTSADSYLNCARDQTDRCTLDLAVADDWVRVSLEERGESVTDADRDALLALGAAVVSNLD